MTSDINAHHCAVGLVVGKTMAMITPEGFMDSETSPQKTLAAKAWIAAVMVGKEPEKQTVCEMGLEFLLAQARAHDVLGMVVWRLQEHMARMGDWGDDCGLVLNSVMDELKREAFVSLLKEREARVLMEVATKTQCPMLFLKGSSLAYWAYPEPGLRRTADVDVLLPSRLQAEVLAQELHRMGYECLRPSGDLVAYELMCRHHLDKGLVLELDIHWRLSNSPLFADAFSFDELWDCSMPIPRLGTAARGLGLVHACMHACMHRALNLSVGVDDKLKWLYDLDVLTARFEDQDWNNLVDMAVTKGLGSVVDVALGTVAQDFHRAGLLQKIDGMQLQRHSQGLHQGLQAAKLKDWRHVQAATFKALPNMVSKLRWIWQRLFPSKDYMIYLYGQDRSYLALMGIRLVNAYRRLKGNTN
jgi:hypothetical protein